MRLSSLVLAVAALVAATACRDKKSAAAEPPFGDVLPNLPLPPGADYVSRSGGNEALQIVLRSPMPPQPMADYYRGTLTHGIWRLVSDTRTGDRVTLYAEQNGPPLWVTIEKDSAGAGSLVSLTGARPDPADSTRRAERPQEPGTARRPIP